MIIFHRTEHGQKIIAEGFSDGEGYYSTEILHRGVWFSNKPLDIHEGAKGKDLLVLEIPDDVLENYEWVEEGKTFREFLLPAELANSYGPLFLGNDEEFLKLEPQ